MLAENFIYDLYSLKLRYRHYILKLFKFIKYNVSIVFLFIRHIDIIVLVNLFGCWNCWIDGEISLKQVDVRSALKS